LHDLLSISATAYNSAVALHGKLLQSCHATESCLAVASS